MGPRTRTRAGGFTLLELSIAITIIMVAIAATFRSHVSSEKLLRTSEETAAAVADLQRAMEEVLILSLDHIPVPGSPYEHGQPIAAFNGLTLTNEQMVATYPNYVPGSAQVPDPLEIVMTVTWDDYAGRQRSLRLASMKTR